MRDPKRIDPFLKTIEKIWKENPDLRFGQLIENAIRAEYLYYIEDDQALRALLSVYMPADTPADK